MIKIKDFKNGMSLKKTFLVKDIKKGITKNNSMYFTLILQDNSGIIEGKIWNADKNLEKKIKIGEIIKLNFNVLYYQKKIQIKINNIIFCDQLKYNLLDYLKPLKFSISFLKKKIKFFINKIKDKIFKKIVTKCFEFYGENFFKFPAATKIHHDFPGGLATHVYTMCKLGDYICFLYPIYNRDLLLSGILIHDMGKINEYSSHIFPNYNVAGKLIGHISIFFGILDKIGENLGYEKTEQLLLLKHLILSHHGQYNFGSPVLPMIKEAEALNFIDNFDARSNVFEKTYSLTEAGKFSNRILALENRFFYKSKKNF